MGFSVFMGETRKLYTSLAPLQQVASYEDHQKVVLQVMNGVLGGKYGDDVGKILQNYLGKKYKDVFVVTDGKVSLYPAYDFTQGAVQKLGGKIQNQHLLNMITMLRHQSPVADELCNTKDEGLLGIMQLAMAHITQQEYFTVLTPTDESNTLPVQKRLLVMSGIFNMVEKTLGRQIDGEQVFAVSVMKSAMPLVANTQFSQTLHQYNASYALTSKAQKYTLAGNKSEVDLRSRFYAKFPTDILATLCDQRKKNNVTGVAGPGEEFMWAFLWMVLLKKSSDCPTADILADLHSFFAETETVIHEKQKGTEKSVEEAARAIITHTFARIICSTMMQDVDDPVDLHGASPPTTDPRGLTDYLVSCLREASPGLQSYLVETLIDLRDFYAKLEPKVYKEAVVDVISLALQWNVYPPVDEGIVVETPKHDDFENEDEEEHSSAESMEHDESATRLLPKDQWCGTCSVSPTMPVVKVVNLPPASVPNVMDMLPSVTEVRTKGAERSADADAAFVQDDNESLESEEEDEGGEVKSDDGTDDESDSESDEDYNPIPTMPSSDKRKAPEEEDIPAPSDGKEEKVKEVAPKRRRADGEKKEKESRPKRPLPEAEKAPVDEPKDASKRARKEGAKDPKKAPKKVKRRVHGVNKVMQQQEMMKRYQRILLRLASTLATSTFEDSEYENLTAGLAPGEKNSMLRLVNEMRKFCPGLEIRGSAPWRKIMDDHLVFSVSRELPAALRRPQDSERVPSPPLISHHAAPNPPQDLVAHDTREAMDGTMVMPREGFTMKFMFQPIGL